MEQELNKAAHGYCIPDVGHSHDPHGDDAARVEEQQLHPHYYNVPLTMTSATATDAPVSYHQGQRSHQNFVPMMTRSSPIAIQQYPKNPNGKDADDNFENHIGVGGNTGDMTSDDDDDDVDDDDDIYDHGYENVDRGAGSCDGGNINTRGHRVVIDVEGDARKLRKKYGNQSSKVAVVQTYQQESSYLRQGLARDNYQSLLRAPYFGSLNSRSGKQILSLPPMSLAAGLAGSNGETRGSLEEPPESLSASSTTATRTAYGSLRDSQERGYFLDGPSSYREPTSGRIRQLDHRVRYHGRTTPSQISISERMEQARRLKELRQKELERAAAASGSSESAGSPSGSGSLSKQQQHVSGTTTPSSLSAMMDEVSKNEEIPALPSATTVGTTQAEWLDDDHQGPKGELVEGPGNMYDNDDLPHMMLSTSLTAFEVLKSTNINLRQEPVRSELLSATTRQSNLPSSSAILSADGFSVNNITSSLSTNTTAVGGLVSSIADVSYYSSTQEQAPGVVRQDRFQPLARSFSDPAPRFRQQQFSLRERTALMSSPTYGPAAATPASPTVRFALPPPLQQQKQIPQYVTPANIDFAATTMMHNNDDALHSDIDRQISETEGAFGDMDLE